MSIWVQVTILVPSYLTPGTRISATSRWRVSRTAAASSVSSSRRSCATRDTRSAAVGRTEIWPREQTISTLGPQKPELRSDRYWNLAPNWSSGRIPRPDGVYSSLLSWRVPEASGSSVSDRWTLMLSDAPQISETRCRIGFVGKNVYAKIHSKCAASPGFTHKFLPRSRVPCCVVCLIRWTRGCGKTSLSAM